jgi:AAA family ATP:ADP antiporter
MHATSISSASPARPGPVTRLLNLFAKVEPGETVTALLLTLNVFLLLTSYYLLKTVREPLILLGGGAEVKSYAAAGQALLLVLTVKGFSRLAQSMGRLRLVTVVTLFFVSNLIVFRLLGKAGVPLGVPFFLWVGVFNVTVIAQFWSFATDLYTPEQGKRLFAIIGIGSSAGAVAGARIARLLFGPLGPFGLMLAAAGILLLALAVTAAAHHTARRRGPVREEAPLAPGGGFTMLARDRYLQLIAVLVVLLNLVNSTGEYVLDHTLLQAAAAQTAVPAAKFVASFKASYFEWVNVVGMLLQLFVVSRVLRHLGVRVALMVLPAVAMIGYGTLALAPVLSLIFVAKVSENSLDYSLQNTTRQTLFLPTSREAKYKAKAVIDTFLMRAGDVLSAGLVWIGHRLLMTPQQLALFNVGLIIAWMGVALALGRRHARLSLAQPVAWSGGDRPALPATRQSPVLVATGTALATR